LRITKLTVSVLLLVTLLITQSPASAAFQQTFESYANGTDLSGIAVPGAVLSANFGNASWVVTTNNGTYASLQNRILRQRNCNASLNIDLDVPHSAIAFRYGTSLSTAVVKVDGWMGLPGSGQLVFSQSFFGTDLGNGKLEGQAVVSGLGYFDFIVIYAPGGCTAIDNLTVRGPQS
jgi:hypothetical protein